VFLALLSKLIGSKDPDALKIPARRAEYSLTESASSPVQAEPAQDQLVRDIILSLMRAENESKKNAPLLKSVKLLPPSTSILDYPESLSMYERESLAGEASLAAERKQNERRKPASG
jgi:hypothetical protein